MPGPTTSALARTVGALGTESAFSVLGRARQLEREGREIVHLEIGEPDFPTPPHVVEAAVQALRDGRTHYAPPAGLPELREAAAIDLSRRRGIEVSPGSVVIGTGAKPLLLFTVLALCEAGDEVICPDPAFPTYPSAIGWAGATVKQLPVREEDGFGLDLDALQGLLSERTKLVILNFPHNPTGGTAGAEVLQAAAELIGETPAWVLSDEIYSRFDYTGQFASIAAVPGMRERTIVVDGLSKGHAMTGWRCGFATLPDDLVDPFERFIVNSTSCVPPFVQDAAVAALTGPQDQLEAMVDQFRARRDLFVGGLNAIDGVTCPTPGGAFYAFPRFAGFEQGAADLAKGLLEDAGVAALDGGTFGACGAGHLRLSYANSTGNLEEGLRRIASYLDEAAGI